MSIMRSFEFRNKICDSSYIYVYVYIYIRIYIIYIYFCYGTFYLFYIVRVATRRFASSDRRLACKERWHEAMQTFFSFYPSLTVGRRAMIHDFHPRFIHTIVCTYLQKRTRSIFFVWKSFSSCKIIYIHLLYRYTKNMYNLVRIYATSTTRALHDSLQLLRIENEIKLAHGFRSPITRE